MTALVRHVSPRAGAALTDLDGRPVARFDLHGPVGPGEAFVVERAVRVALDVGVPVVGCLSTPGPAVEGGVASLHGWGRAAAALAGASGVVPVVLAATGPCLSGAALVLGLADHVVMADEAVAYVSGPQAVAETTGVATNPALLGGAHAHATRTGLASLVVPTGAVDDAVADLLSYLPANLTEAPPVAAPGRGGDLTGLVPEQPAASYDVRRVVEAVADEGTFLEVRPLHAPNLVTGYARLAGAAVGVVANQPCQRAGTVDIAAARKGAAFVQSCDAFGLSLVTFVDTPGFEPGRDQEWRGMIRHGAKLVHAYAEATVPRLCVVLRKAYGGAYIVMDSKGLGNDWCAVWPGAEIAVMGAAGAAAVLGAGVEDEYGRRFLNPWRAAERGYVDEVVEPAATRAALAEALARLRSKREQVVARRHSNVPL